MDDLTNTDGPLERYISVLEVLAPFPEGLAASDVESMLGLPKTTVNRLLKTLNEAGLIAASGIKSRNVVLGRRLLRLLHTSSDSSWIEIVTKRPLQALADKTGESCFIVKLSGLQIRSVNSEAPDTPVRTYVVPGSIMPINAAASAKAILAWQEEQVVAALLEQPLAALTANSTTDKAKLRQELEVVREKGYATDMAEHVEGLASIACPIHTKAMGVIYAIGLTGPYHRIVGEAFERHVADLKHTAAQLAKSLAFEPD
ncbi:helix-turn-helix domain-containing protein [Mesorhizobium sp. AR02]|uniref:IclR family transcriptional regulator n=1 Tax=Mesorhizobium sp. AR02 TaxID=2865837 RepID=UPI00215DDE88|nr:IclR family transcriptional regulator C-terminal domain-containing protein [Mesorhizobium sp. AR02]UVK54593.1 helix-turn-helix domain-containing protein [Mesorhizobium sp. AR02]